MPTRVPMKNRIFVFDTNEAGMHITSVAHEAYETKKARWGMSYGHYGTSFAIPTRDIDMKPLSYPTIKAYVNGFLAYARGHKKMTFHIAQIGCDLYNEEHMAALFVEAPFNCLFDEAWKDYLPEDKEYWGTKNYEE